MLEKKLFTELNHSKHLLNNEGLDRTISENFSQKNIKALLILSFAVPAAQSVAPKLHRDQQVHMLTGNKQ